MTATPDSITVITLTRARPALLKRAIDAVRGQDYVGGIAHLAVIDDCPLTRDWLASAGNLPENFRWLYLPRQNGEQSGPARVAKLRNYAVRETSTRWVSFLDDDNEFEPHHLSSLVACAAAGRVAAVHSYRKLLWADGTPYLEQRMPWRRDAEEGRRLYRELAARGVFQPGSNVVRDRADPLGHTNPVRMIDTGEWLLERQLLCSHSFPTEYGLSDWANVTTEDDKLVEALVKSRVPIGRSGLATLKYYLGGYSNAFDSGQWTLYGV